MALVYEDPRYGALAPYPHRRRHGGPRMYHPGCNTCLGHRLPLPPLPYRNRPPRYPHFNNCEWCRLWTDWTELTGGPDDPLNHEMHRKVDVIDKFLHPHPPGYLNLNLGYPWADPDALGEEIRSLARFLGEAGNLRRGGRRRAALCWRMERDLFEFAEMLEGGRAAWRGDLVVDYPYRDRLRLGWL